MIKIDKEDGFLPIFNNLNKICSVNFFDKLSFVDNKGRNIEPTSNPSKYWTITRHQLK
jgi:hypothetical protein